MIDREELIEDIRAYADLKCANGEVELANGILKTLSVINGQPQINKWIPVSERLPEKIKKWEDLLICSGGKVRFGASYNKELYIVYRDGYIRDEKAIAWQPLPEPYKEG